MRMEVIPTEVAWAAGFYDGEGHARIHDTTRNGRTMRSIRIQIGQAERAPLERFQRAAFGLGNITYWDGGGTAHTPMYVWQASAWRDVQAVAAALWPFLCEPKKEQLRPVLAHIPDITHRPPRSRSDMDIRCPHGHDRETYGYRWKTRWQCRECSRLRAAARRQGLLTTGQWNTATNRTP